MADTADTPASALDKAQIATLAYVVLTPEQTARIKEDIGIEVTRLLVQKESRSAARDIDPGFVSVVRLTWCW